MDHAESIRISPLDGNGILSLFRFFVAYASHSSFEQTGKSYCILCLRWHVPSYHGYSWPCWQRKFVLSFTELDFLTIYESLLSKNIPHRPARKTLGKCLVNTPNQHWMSNSPSKLSVSFTPFRMSQFRMQLAAVLFGGKKRDTMNSIHI